MPISHTHTFNESHLNADGSFSYLKFDGLHTRLRKQLDELTSSTKNFVVADLSVIIKTTAGKVLSLSVPVRASAWKSFGHTSLKQNNEVSAMSDFYKAHKNIGGKGKFHAQSHGHSEAYLYYYLQSPTRLEEIFNLLITKGLQANNVQQVLGARLHICTTNSMCGTCTDLTLGTHLKSGFIQSFSTTLQQAFAKKNIQVATNFTFEVCPSYAQDYGHNTNIKHLNPSSLIIAPHFPNILKRFEDVSHLKCLQEAKQTNSTRINYIEAERSAKQRKEIAADLLGRESLTDRLNITRTHSHVATARKTSNSIWISQSCTHTGFVSSSNDTQKSSSTSKDLQDTVQDLGKIAHKTLLKFFKACKQKNERHERLVSESYISSCL